jgi:hypothetical protein
MQCIHSIKKIWHQAQICNLNHQSLQQLHVCKKGGNTIFDKLVIPFVHVEQDLNFWKYVEGSFALRDIISKCQKTLFVVTHIINFPKDYVAI